MLFQGCEIEEANETWNERTKDMVHDTTAATERARDSLARIRRHWQGVK